MNKADKLERSWRNGAISDVKENEVMLVLQTNGFQLRSDRGQHWLAEHEGLAHHPQFGIGQKMGRIKISCHTRRTRGLVHPLSVKVVLQALAFLKEA